MESGLEKLVGHKSFVQLSQKDKTAVLKIMTEVEYERSRLFLKLSKTSFEEDYNDLKPNPRIKSKIKAAYQIKFKEIGTQVKSEEKKQNKRSVLRPTLIYVPVAAFVILSTVIFFKVKGFVDPISQTTAMNINEIENFELLREQMSLKDTGMYSEIVVPEVNMKMISVRLDTLLTP